MGEEKGKSWTKCFLRVNLDLHTQTEEAVASLARENQQLYKEQQEHLSFLDDARSTVSSLKQTLEEQQLVLICSNRQHSRSIH